MKYSDENLETTNTYTTKIIKNTIKMTSIDITSNYLQRKEIYLYKKLNF